MMGNKIIFLALIFLICCGVANGKVLFVDDFEKDSVGKEPSNWEHLEFASGNSKITIEVDPTNPKNKVAKTTGIGLYIPKADGRENWSDYIWDFDWMWENDSYVGTIYRVEGSEAHFHGSRRQGATEIHIYTRKAGNWAKIAGGTYPNENKVWYSHRLIIKGNKHQIFMKRKDDNTPFENLKPVVETENDMFKKGPVGMMGITSGVSYFDNMIVFENLDDLRVLQPVNPSSKLSTVWGEIKKLQ